MISEKMRFSPGYCAAMRTAYTRMAADKSIVNRIQGMKIVKVASPNVEKGKAVIRLNPMQYYYFKKDTMNGLRYSKEAAKIGRVENWETAYKYLSNAAVLCGSSELAVSVIRTGMLLYKTNKDFTEKELKTTLFGREDKEAYAYLKEVYSSLCTVRDLLEIMVSTPDGQKMVEAQLKKDKEDQEKEIDGTEDKLKSDGTEDKLKSAANTSRNMNKNGKEDPSANGKGNEKEGQCGSGNGSGNGNDNGNGEFFGS